MKEYCFGIDIGGTTVKCGLFNVKGDILEKWEIPTRTENNGVNILPDVAATIDAKIQEKGIARDTIAGVGVGIPGPVNEEGAVICAVNLHWGYVELEKELEKLTGLTVKAGNDANVAALGEMWKGGGAGYHNVVMVTLGTGVGGGIIVNGKIVTGTHGAGGEIGHVHVEDDEHESCNCGNQGCLEQYASATGIARLEREWLEKSDEPSVLRDREISAKAVFDAVKEGDALAKKVADEFGAYLGKAVASMTAILDPEVIVIGGGVSKAGTFLTDWIDRYYRELTPISENKGEVRLATLGNDAGIYGAARLILD